LQKLKIDSVLVW